MGGSSRATRQGTRHAARLPRGRGRLAVVAAVLLPLAACSVPREAYVTAASSSTAAATPPASSPGTASADPAASASPGQSSRPSPSASPTPTQVRQPEPVAVSGYSLGGAPSSVANPLAGVPGATDVFGATTVRSVSKGQTPVGLIFLFAVRPQYLNEASVTKAVVTRLTTSIEGSGVPMSTQRYGQQTVVAGSSARNGTIVLWYDSGVLTVVVGSDSSLVTDYARAVIAAR